MWSFYSMSDAKKNPTKLLWVDLEMTGLDVEKEVIIEVAAVATDLKFNTLDQYHAVVKQPQKYLDAMDDWNKTHHKASGLTDKIPHGKEPDLVENELLLFIAKNFEGERPILCGNSIAQDRLFIDKYWKRLADKLHYRMLDVSSWKIIMNSVFQKVYHKTNTHRAVDDILESIGELKFYLSFFKQG